MAKTIANKAGMIDQTEDEKSISSIKRYLQLMERTESKGQNKTRTTVALHS